VLGIIHLYPTGYPTVGSCASVLFKGVPRGMSQASCCISRTNIVKSVQEVSALKKHKIKSLILFMFLDRAQPVLAGILR
jgi:hypothetical protein